MDSDEKNKAATVPSGGLVLEPAPDHGDDTALIREAITACNAADKLGHKIPAAGSMAPAFAVNAQPAVVLRSSSGTDEPRVFFTPGSTQDLVRDNIRLAAKTLVTKSGLMSLDNATASLPPRVTDRSGSRDEPLWTHLLLPQTTITDIAPDARLTPPTSPRHARREVISSSMATIPTPSTAATAPPKPTTASTKLADMPPDDIFAKLDAGPIEMLRRIGCNENEYALCYSSEERRARLQEFMKKLDIPGVTIDRLGLQVSPEAYAVDKDVGWKAQCMLDAFKAGLRIPEYTFVREKHTLAEEAKADGVTKDDREVLAASEDKPLPPLTISELEDLRDAGFLSDEQGANWFGLNSRTRGIRIVKAWVQSVADIEPGEETDTVEKPSQVLEDTSDAETEKTITPPAKPLAQRTQVTPPEEPPAQLTKATPPAEPPAQLTKVTPPDEPPAQRIQIATEMIKIPDTNAATALDDTKAETTTPTRGSSIAAQYVPYQNVQMMPTPCHGHIHTKPEYRPTVQRNPAATQMPEHLFWDPAAPNMVSTVTYCTSATSPVAIPATQYRLPPALTRHMQDGNTFRRKTPVSQRLCPFLAKGFCSKGNQCDYLHSEEQMRINAARGQRNFTNTSRPAVRSQGSDHGASRKSWGGPLQSPRREPFDKHGSVNGFPASMAEVFGMPLTHEMLSELQGAGPQGAGPQGPSDEGIAKMMAESAALLGQAPPAPASTARAKTSKSLSNESWGTMLPPDKNPSNEGWGTRLAVEKKVLSNEGWGTMLPPDKTPSNEGWGTMLPPVKKVLSNEGWGTMLPPPGGMVQRKAEEQNGSTRQHQDKSNNANGRAQMQFVRSFLRRSDTLETETVCTIRKKFMPFWSHGDVHVSLL
ncbi:hypothetical protein BDV95DRAFT_639516 [Massariosphaeria phaeospora]|uniref:C3H1-type domain-containing protein n=1 Tax=Massariosphaeria phaeospora TaxID=100035 RepID=A0A7C8M7Y7_9PLEO|nr:hypothetical protein BDV95DRAFT_639516 [Massariosphaeria phaeospora]